MHGRRVQEIPDAAPGYLSPWINEGANGPRLRWRPARTRVEARVYPIKIIWMRRATAGGPATACGRSSKCVDVSLRPNSAAHPTACWRRCSIPEPSRRPAQRLALPDIEGDRPSTALKLQMAAFHNPVSQGFRDVEHPSQLPTSIKGAGSCRSSFTISLAWRHKR